MREMHTGWIVQWAAGRGFAAPAETTVTSRLIVRWTVNYDDSLRFRSKYHCARRTSVAAPSECEEKWYINVNNAMQ